MQMSSLTELENIHKGSKYAIFEASDPTNRKSVGFGIVQASDPKNNSRYGSWNQKPQMLGNWTLWVTTSPSPIQSHAPRAHPPGQAGFCRPHLNRASRVVRYRWLVLANMLHVVRYTHRYQSCDRVTSISPMNILYN